MKKISAVLVFSLMSTIAFANSSDFKYANYKELYFNDVDSGTYSFSASCTDNNLQWNKTEKKYTRTITKTTSNGHDIIQINGDSAKVTTNSVDSDGAKYYGETISTFLSENNYVRHNKSRTVNTDGTEFKTDKIVEGNYLEGKFNTTKIIKDGVEVPVKKSTYIFVANDNQSNSYYEAFTYEPSNIKEQMEDASIESLTIRLDTVCRTQYTKL